MQSGPLHDQKSAARLLAAATLFDLLVLVFLTRLVGGILASGLPRDDRFVAHALIFFVLFLIFIVVTELLPGARSLGRRCLGLKVRNSDGSLLAWSTRVTRMLRRLVTLGLGGLNLNKLSYWDRATGVVWASPMAPRPISDWRLAIRSGARQGEVLVLGMLPGWDTPKRAIKIGRDRTWSDLALPQDSSVSGKHAVLMAKGEELRVLDYGSSGRGSTHGTFVDGRRVPQGGWSDLTQAEQLAVGDVRIRIVR